MSNFIFSLAGKMFVREPGRRSCQATRYKVTSSAHDDVERHFKRDAKPIWLPFTSPNTLVPSRNEPHIKWQRRSPTTPTNTAVRSASTWFWATLVAGRSPPIHARHPLFSTISAQTDTLVPAQSSFGGVMVDHVSSALMSFIQGDDKHALMLRGAWGVGKTTFWKNFAKAKIVSEPTCAEGVACYSYVSLFGKSSIAELQAAIVRGTEPLGDGETARASVADTLATHARRLKKLVPDSVKESEMLKRMLQRITTKANELEVPVLGKVGDWFNAFDLLQKYLIVLDDLERRSSELDLTDVFGLVDELATRRNCKVVIICNEDALLNDDKDVLNRYRDKLFDLEVSLIRSAAEIAALGLGSINHAAHAVDALSKLQVSNIRVAKKLRQLLELVLPLLTDAHKSAIEEVISHAALLVWGRFESTVGIPMQEMRQRSTEGSWIRTAVRGLNRGARAERAETAAPAWEQKWDAACDAIRYSASKYDAVFVDYLEHGTFDTAVFRAAVADKDALARETDAKERIANAWALFVDSLNPDATPFLDAMCKVLEDDLLYFSAGDLDSALSLLEELGHDTTAYAARFAEAAPERLAGLDEHRRVFGQQAMSQTLAPFVKSATELAAVTLPTLSDAIARIGEARGWRPQDIAVVSACSDAELIEWLRSDSVPVREKIWNGLQFRGLQSDDPKVDEIRAKATRALQSLATESQINQLRARRLYGIKPATN